MSMTATLQIIEKLRSKGYERRPVLYPADLVSLSPLRWNEEIEFFFCQINGPLWSSSLGFELLDLFGEDSMAESTAVAREQYSFHPNHVVLTNMAAGEVLVANIVGGDVYRVDFEEGADLFASGVLKATWVSFSDFLEVFFLDEL